MKLTTVQRLVAFVGVSAFSVAAQARTLYVAQNGYDTNAGTIIAPFRTIQHAADLAQPGDVITVRAGVYRERINPPRGGTSDAKRIIYQAAPGQKVVITGADEIKDWVQVKAGIWKASFPNSFFGKFNPYSDVIHGDWFNALGRVHHTGEVYIDGIGLTEAASLDDLMNHSAGEPLWFGQVDNTHTTIWAQFKDRDPNRQPVEINVRETVFYPVKTGINYITVRGFTMEDAATQWAPPTAEQIGVIGPHWSKGWIIENNVVRNSICSGISLGKYGDKWDNTSANTASGYVETIQRALADGWSKDEIGHHIVRNNTIYNCGQAGIVGSLGGAFSTITGNSIYNIHVGQTFAGEEIAGIKLHAALDVLISHNNIYRSPLGLWLDWMAQGTRVDRNLFHDNVRDVYVEVNHGPFVFANNIFLSPISLRDLSESGAYVHNLFAGSIDVRSYGGRQTPYLKPHSTAIAGLRDNPRGDDRYYNNLIIGQADLSGYDDVPLPMRIDGNVYLDGAKPSKLDEHATAEADFDPHLQLIAKPDGFYLRMRFDRSWIDAQPHKLVTSLLLGRAVIPDLPYELPDGSSLRINTDYFGKMRSRSDPTPGPFESPGVGEMDLKVW